jgi:hypothetical protein
MFKVQCTPLCTVGPSERRPFFKRHKFLRDGSVVAYDPAFNEFRGGGHHMASRVELWTKADEHEGYELAGTMKYDAWMREVFANGFVALCTPPAPPKRTAVCISFSVIGDGCRVLSWRGLRSATLCSAPEVRFGGTCLLAHGSNLLSFERERVRWVTPAMDRVHHGSKVDWPGVPVAACQLESRNLIAVLTQVEARSTHGAQTAQVAALDLKTWAVVSLSPPVQLVCARRRKKHCIVACKNNRVVFSTDEWLGAVDLDANRLLWSRPDCRTTQVRAFGSHVVCLHFDPCERPSVLSFVDVETGTVTEAQLDFYIEDINTDDKGNLLVVHRGIVFRVEISEH